MSSARPTTYAEVKAALAQALQGKDPTALDDSIADALERLNHPEILDKINALIPGEQARFWGTIFQALEEAGRKPENIDLSLESATSVISLYQKALRFHKNIKSDNPHTNISQKLFREIIHLISLADTAHEQNPKSTFNLYYGVNGFKGFIKSLAALFDRGIDHLLPALSGANIDITAGLNVLANIERTHNIDCSAIYEQLGQLPVTSEDKQKIQARLDQEPAFVAALAAHQRILSSMEQVAQDHPLIAIYKTIAREIQAKQKKDITSTADLTAVLVATNVLFAKFQANLTSPVLLTSVDINDYRDRIAAVTTSISLPESLVALIHATLIPSLFNYEEAIQSALAAYDAAFADGPKRPEVANQLRERMRTIYRAARRIERRIDVYPDQYAVDLLQATVVLWNAVKTQPTALTQEQSDIYRSVSSVKYGIGYYDDLSANTISSGMLYTAKIYTQAEQLRDVIGTPELSPSPLSQWKQAKLEALKQAVPAFIDLQLAAIAKEKKPSEPDIWDHGSPLRFLQTIETFIHGLRSDSLTKEQVVDFAEQVGMQRQLNKEDIAAALEPILRHVQDALDEEQEYQDSLTRVKALKGLNPETQKHVQESITEIEKLKDEGRPVELLLRALHSTERLAIACRDCPKDKAVPQALIDSHRAVAEEIGKHSWGRKLAGILLCLLGVALAVGIGTTIYFTGGAAALFAAPLAAKGIVLSATLINAGAAALAGTVVGAVPIGFALHRFFATAPAEQKMQALADLAGKIKPTIA